MRVFCTNCGQQNEAAPGTKVMCVSCTAVFEVPAEGALPPEPAAPVRPANPFTLDPPPSAPLPPAPQAPVKPGFEPFSAAPRPYAPLQSVNPPQQPSWGNPSQATYSYTPRPANNPLAIGSLVSALLCCVPFNSVAAVVMGLIALSQLNDNPNQAGKGLAVAGTAIGSVMLALEVLAVLVSLVNSH